MGFLNKALSFVFQWYVVFKEYSGNHFNYKYHTLRVKLGKIEIIYSVKGNRKTYSMDMDNFLNEEKNIIDHFPPRQVKAAMEDFYELKTRYGSELFSTTKKIIEKKVTEKSYKYLSILYVFYVGLLLTAIYMSPNLVQIGDFIEPRGILMFPLTYIIADIISEIYGYYHIRKLIYTILGLLSVLALVVYISVRLQAYQNTIHTSEYLTVFGVVPKLLIANVVAVVISDFLNAYLFDRIKKLTQGNYLWLRLIAASSIAELLFTFIWIYIFFYFFNYQHLPFNTIFSLMLSNFSFKLLYGFLSIPATYLVVPFIKHRENLINA